MGKVCLTWRAEGSTFLIESSLRRLKFLSKVVFLIDLLCLHEYGSASLRPITLNSQLVLVVFLRVLFLDTVVSFG